MNVTCPILLSALLIGVSGIETYFLETGKSLRGEVLEFKPPRVKLRVQISGGSFDKWFGLAEFEPHSAYRMLRSVAKADDPKAHLELAQFAASKSLIAVARRELRNARRLSGRSDLGPDVEKLIERNAADGLERLFRAALQKGRLKSADSYLSAMLIRHPAARSATAKKALVAMLEEKRRASAAARSRAKAARVVSAAAKRRDALLRAPRKNLEVGKAAIRRGLLDSRQFSRAHQSFSTALHQFEFAIRKTTVLQRRYRTDAALMHETSDIRREAEELIKTGLLNSGSLCLVRGKFTSAMEHVNRILAMDPKNAGALSMRARIEIAANQTGYGY